MLSRIPGLEAKPWVKPPIGFSKDEVYIIKKGYIDGFKEKDIVIKKSSREEVVLEAINFEWLQSFCKVPKIYRYGMVGCEFYCMMEFLPGVMFQELLKSYPKEQVIQKYASLIRQFHEIDPSGLPHNHSLEQKIKQVEQSIKDKTINPSHFEKEFKGWSIDAVYQKLLEYLPTQEDLVLCHGDVCMPNIMMNGLELVGYIDIVGIGVCDRYLDIAIGLRSLRYNLEAYGYRFDDDVIELFIKEYGICELDKDKVYLYILLDELTVG